MPEQGKDQLFKQISMTKLWLILTLKTLKVLVDSQTEENNDMNKRRRKGFNSLREPPTFSSRSLGSSQEGSGSKEGGNQNKVKSMASQLLAKFEENSRNPSLLKQVSPGPARWTCFLGDQN
uniref:Microtubule associated monooxygenase, calponin and LIM domain containing 2 n=1 Tax=Molossus molossus TaxID=27622 RepID=A0A7J8ERS6_MOLMO|nr:microtubule associated monooxygenase, calponin and LIM domain containing 2 [Molossus molossus]